MLEIRMWLKEIFGAWAPEPHHFAEADDGDEFDGDNDVVNLSDGCFHGAVEGEVLLPARISSPTWRSVLTSTARSLPA